MVQRCRFRSQRSDESCWHTRRKGVESLRRRSVSVRDPKEDEKTKSKRKSSRDVVCNCISNSSEIKQPPWVGIQRSDRILQLRRVRTD
ncbi:hypothetical protein Fmac_012563 [Flemingia macrophylla]|uniref:Uncharacterized protein n=1 Tax=Flemingia macrophylla TaxID=520843 RepID=A0ABD1MRG7_9FABA